MEIKKLTTVTAMHARVGTRIAYTYSTIDTVTGQPTRRNIRGSLVLTKGMEDAAAAVKALENYLAEKLPGGDRPGTLTSFCIFQSTEGTAVTYMYDEIDAQTGATVTKNNQATLTLVEGYMDDQIEAAAALKTFVSGRL